MELGHGLNLQKDVSKAEGQKETSWMTTYRIQSWAELEAMEKAISQVHYYRLPLHIFDRPLPEYAMQQKPHSFQRQLVPLLQL